jgi:eukaryotic-like serine/threonine-protein kinase
MGVVYAALDQRRQATVALKTLTRLDAMGIYRLKNEFRALAGVQHPNLVRLHDLFAEGDQWFFTMDLVAGRSFIEHVRPDSVLSGPALRDALRQLALGVRAIHDEGKLHRDLKPSNVLVAPDGRLTVLDFGLVSSQVERPIGETAEDVLAGTPAYMAPEQASDRALPASDWYAVGVMLYEALTGELPHAGTLRQILIGKQTIDPEAPARRCDGVPEDLSALCVALLGRDPDRRATGADILRVLGDAGAVAAVSPGLGAEQSGAPFVGRSSELRAIESAWEASRAGSPVLALVGGPSGVGKTALVARFLARAEAEPCTLVLRGRCYEREFVPFKAFDGVIDSLGRHMRSLPRHRAAELLPRDVHALARLFPTLQRIDVVASAISRPAEQLDDRVLRRRAFVALRELCARLCDRGPLVIFVDDLQWGDVDSAALLEELVGPPEPPPILYLGCFREDGESSEMVQRALALGGRGWTAAVRRVPLGPLTAGEAADLARRLMGDPESSPRSAQIAAESRGVPYFVGELVRFAETRPGSDERARPTSLAHVVVARARTLPEPAQRLLEVVAFAGRVIPVELAAGVARIERPRDAHESLDTLLAAKLLRRTGSTDDVVTYHDGVRETIVASLGDTQARDLYERLALAVEATRGAEAEWLCQLFQGADLRKKAGAQAVIAGDQAAQGLAFTRAADHYRYAIAALEPEGDSRSTLQRRLGDALANGALSVEAAEAYDAAMRDAPAENKLELDRLRGEQLVRAGRIQEGLRVFRDVLGRAGVRCPESTPAILAALLWARARVGIRGLSYTLREESEVPKALMQRVHALRAAYPVGGVNPVLGALIMSQYVIVALDAGVPDHVMHVIVGEGVYAAVFGGTEGAAKVESLASEVLRLEKAVATPAGASRTKYFEGMTSFLLGRWRAAVTAIVEAEARQTSGLSWELTDLVAKGCQCLLYLGELGPAGERVPRLVREARERRDAPAFEQLLGAQAMLHVAADRTDAARDVLEEVEPRWREERLSATAVFALRASVQRMLYLGDPVGAHAHLAEVWPRYERSGLSRVQAARVPMQWAFAATAIERAIHEKAPVPRATRRLVHSLSSEDLDWCRGHGLQLQAALAFCEGHRAKAADLLARAVSAFDAADMKLDAASCRRQRGRIVGGSEGDESIRSADEALRAAGVRNPAAWAAMAAAGFGR